MRGRHHRTPPSPAAALLLGALAGPAPACVSSVDPPASNDLGAVLFTLDASTEGTVDLRAASDGLYLLAVRDALRRNVGGATIITAPPYPVLLRVPFASDAATVVPLPPAFEGSVLAPVLGAGAFVLNQSTESAASSFAFDGATWSAIPTSSLFPAGGVIPREGLAAPSRGRFVVQGSDGSIVLLEGGARRLLASAPAAGTQQQLASMDDTHVAVVELAPSLQLVRVKRYRLADGGLEGAPVERPVRAGLDGLASGACGTASDFRFALRSSAPGAAASPGRLFFLRFVGGALVTDGEMPGALFDGRLGALEVATTEARRTSPLRNLWTLSSAGDARAVLEVPEGSDWSCAGRGPRVSDGLGPPACLEAHASALQPDGRVALATYLGVGGAGLSLRLRRFAPRAPGASTARLRARVFNGWREQGAGAALTVVSPAAGSRAALEAPWALPFGALTEYRELLLGPGPSAGPPVLRFLSGAATAGTESREHSLALASMPTAEGASVTVVLRAAADGSAEAAVLAETPPQAGVVLVHALNTLAEPAAGTQFATRASGSGGSCFDLSREAQPNLFTTFRLDFTDATRQTLSFSRACGASGAPEREFLPTDPPGNWLALLDAYANNAYHVLWAPSGR